MDFIFFEKEGITAGFTKAPERHTDRLDAFVKESVPGAHVITAHQVHGIDVAAVTEDTLKGRETLVHMGDCDGFVTDLPSVILTTKHADCVPLYAYDTVKGVIGLAHAGWRGTAAGMAASLIRAMKEHYSCDPSDIKAAIGPSIGLCHFEVSQDAAEVFKTKMPWSEKFIDKGIKAGKYMIDLKGINAFLFGMQGVKDVFVSPVCTYCDAENCWSYRRNGTAERHLAYIRK